MPDSTNLPLEVAQFTSPQDVVTFTAVYGTFSLFPGIFPAVVGVPPLRFDVEPLWLDSLKDEERGIDVPATDCTTFRVLHRSRPWPDTIDDSVASTLFDDALAAISEVLLWFKKGTLGPAGQHARQVGRVDVKFFSIAGGSRGSRLAWRAPSPRPPAAISQVMPRFRMTNGPEANPTTPDVRRFQASVDLWNLGFHTEAFITAFALLDDVTQDVLRRGLSLQGISTSEAEELLRAVRENRLQRYLTGLMALSGWRDLSSDSPDLMRAVISANRVRNEIMHGAVRLAGHEALAHLHTLHAALGWLAGNPFGRVVPAMPPVNVVIPDFVFLERPGGDPSAGGTPSPS